MQINPLFKIGDIVYSVTDPEQNARMVTGYTVRKNNLMYLVTFVDRESPFEAFELSTEKTFR